MINLAVISTIETASSEKVVAIPGGYLYIRIWLPIISLLIYLFFSTQVILITNFANWKDPQYRGPYPSWAVGIGWCMMISSLIVFPIDWIYQFFTSKQDTYLEVRP